MAAKLTPALIFWSSIRLSGIRIPSVFQQMLIAPYLQSSGGHISVFQDMPNRGVANKFKKIENNLFRYQRTTDVGVTECE